MIWVGPKESDIFRDKGFFKESITICGTGEGKNHSRSNDLGQRENYNSDYFKPGNFFSDQLNACIKRNKEANIMLYNPQLAYAFPTNIFGKVICLNDSSTLEFLNNKADFRSWASSYVPIVPYFEGGGKEIFEGLEPGKFIVQKPHSSGGYGTTLYTGINNNFNVEDGVDYLISNYYKKSISCNINVIVFDDNVLIFPPSIQIIHIYKGKFLYMGADYSAFKNIHPKQKDTLHSSCTKISQAIRGLGYRGIIGFDYIISENEVLLLEANARFQASTFLLSSLLEKNNLPVIFELNRLAFAHAKAPKVNLFSDNSLGSALSYLEGTDHNALIAIKRDYTKQYDITVLYDGYDVNDECEEGAYTFRCIFPSDICGMSPDNQVTIHQNLVTTSNEEQKQVISPGNLIAKKVALLNQGVAFSKPAKDFINNFRPGVHSSIDIRLDNEMVINCPIALKYTGFTPFQIEYDATSNVLFLSYYDKFLCNISLFSRDTGQLLKTSKGNSYSLCAFWATDRLRVHHTDICTYKASGTSCAFCDASIEQQSFDLDDVSEVLDYYSEQEDIKHYLIGGSSAPLEHDYSTIINTANLIRKKSTKDIYVMSLPITSKQNLQKLYNVGVTQIAFNIEIFDRKIAQKYMPGKGKIPLQNYLNALSLATEIWGRDGNVRTLFVAGLEPTQSILKGIGTVVSLGVQPILSVFRPLSQTPLYDWCPPTNQWLMELFEKATTICEHKGLALGPDCPECRNNTLSI